MPLADVVALRQMWAEKQKREDLRAGTIAAAVMNLAGRKSNGQQFRPDDFFPSLQKDQTVEDLTAALLASGLGVRAEE